MSLKEVFYKALEAGYKRGWHKLVAKYARAPGLGRYQSLLHHSINSALVGWRLAEVIDLDEKYLMPLFVGLFLHDYMKCAEDFQSKVTQGKLVSPEKIPYGRYKEEFEEIIDEFGLKDIMRDYARRIAYLNEAPSSVYDYTEMFGVGPLPEKLLDVAILADILNSIKGYWELRGHVAEILNKYGLSIAYHQVSMVRGVVTQLVHRAVESVMKKKGYEPIIYLADGTIYIGKNRDLPVKGELEEELRSTLKDFLESVGSHRLGEVAFGAINQVIVKVPEYLLISNDAVKGFWNHIKSSRVVMYPNIEKFIVKLQEMKPSASNVERENMAINLKTIHNLWTIFNGVRQVFEQRGVPQETWIKVLREAFGNQNFDELSELANTTNTDRAISICLDFYLKSGLDSLDQNGIIEKLIDVFYKATIEMRKKIEEKGLEKRIFAEPLKMLLDEVTIVSTYTGEMFIIQPEKLSSGYVSGKDKGAPTCIICGRKGVFDAPASLVGGGTERFLNQLPAGVRLRKGMKARICHICRLEGSLRNLANIDPVRNNIYYIVPFFTMAPEYFKTYWEALNKALSSGGKLSLVSYEFRKKFLGLDDERIKPWEIANDPLKLHTALGKSENEVLKEVAEMLKKEYSLEDLSFEYNIEINDWKQAARIALTHGFNKVHLGSDYSLISFAGNYIILSAPSLGSKNEAESSKILRRLNLGLLLHLFYHAAVYMPNKVMTPFANPRPLGATRVPLKADQQSCLSEKGFKLINGWIPIEKAEELANILTAAELIQDELLKVRASYGESGLLNLLTRPPGMILRRYIESLRRPNLKNIQIFLEYLEILERWWYESSSS